MIRKLLTVVEETRQEGGQIVDQPTRKAAAIAVIWNPYVGRLSASLPSWFASMQSKLASGPFSSSSMVT